MTCEGLFCGFDGWVDDGNGIVSRQYLYAGEAWLKRVQSVTLDSLLGKTY